jgi:hypothetical protein
MEEILCVVWGRCSLDSTAFSGKRTAMSEAKKLLIRIWYRSHMHGSAGHFGIEKERSDERYDDGSQEFDV